MKGMDALYVPGLKNLISVSSLEDREYEVVFQGGQVLLYPRGSYIKYAPMIGVHSGRLYRFMF